MIEAILKYVDSHSQGVILALLVIIAAGSVSGSLWINSLEASLDHVDEQIAAIDERHHTQLTDLRRESTLWKVQAEALRKGLGELTSDISLVHDELILIQSGSEAPGDEIIDSVLKQVILLQERATKLDGSLSVSDAALYMLSTVDEVVLYSFDRVLPLYTPLSVLAGVLLLTVGTVLWIRRRRRQ